MKPNRVVVISISLAVMAAFTACNERQPGVEPGTDSSSTGSLQQAAKNAVAASQKPVALAQAEAVHASQKALDNLGGKIDTLKQKAANRSGEARSKTDAALDELTKLQPAAARQPDQLKGATGETWPEAKAASDDAWLKLNETYERVKDVFNG